MSSPKQMMVVKATLENARSLAGLDTLKGEMLFRMVVEADHRDQHIWVRWIGALGVSWIQWQCVGQEHDGSPGLLIWLNNEDNWQ